MAVYLLISDGSALLPDGVTVAAKGVVVQRILWDGSTPYVLPPGVHAAADDGTQIATASAAVPVVNKALFASGKLL